MYKGGLHFQRSMKSKMPTQKALELYALHEEVDESLTVQEVLESIHTID